MQWLFILVYLLTRVPASVPDLSLPTSRQTMPFQPPKSAPGPVEVGWLVVRSSPCLFWLWARPALLT